MNMYVRCIGKIKVYQENINFNGYKMRKIVDHNEITYHNLEAIFAHLVNQDPIKARTVLSQNKPNPVNQSRNTINNNSNNNNNMNNNRMGNSNSNSNNNGNNNGGMAGMNNNMNNMSMNSGNGNGNDGGNMMIEEDNRERSPLEIAILQFLRRSEDANEKNSSYDGCHVDKILAAFDDNQRNEIRYDFFVFVFLFFCFFDCFVLVFDENCARMCQMYDCNSSEDSCECSDFWVFFLFWCVEMIANYWIICQVMEQYTRQWMMNILEHHNNLIIVIQTQKILGEKNE